MPRGRKKLTLDERIQETQQCIYNLETRTQELYEELEELLGQKKREKLEKLSQALEEAGLTVDEVLTRLREEPLTGPEGREEKDYAADKEANIA